jgi:hypothetical protein
VYEPVLNVMKESVMFIIPIRDKEAVVNSLDRTHSGLFPEEYRNKTYYRLLYDEYYTAIDLVSAHYNRIFVHYEDLVKNTFFNNVLRHF